MKNLVLLASLMLIEFVAFSGKPMEGVAIYVEAVKSGEAVAFQQTNKQGVVEFAKLGKGTYNLVVILQRQKGKYESKLVKKNQKQKVAYHTGKKMYFLQEPGGYYIIKYSGINNISNSNISPAYEVKKIKNNQERHVIGKFEVKGKKGALTLKIEAFTESDFSKSLEKVKYDAELMLISERKSYPSDGKKNG